jgi:hypothetical protein
VLKLDGVWSEDGHRFALWSPDSRALIATGLADLRVQLAETLSPACTHVRGQGGVKRTVRFAQAMTTRLPFVARFDIRSYYESIDHDVLLDQFRLRKHPSALGQHRHRHRHESDLC